LDIGLVRSAGTRVSTFFVVVMRMIVSLSNRPRKVGAVEAAAP
jgi:hypothetical protein